MLRALSDRLSGGENIAGISTRKMNNLLTHSDLKASYLLNGTADLVLTPSTYAFIRLSSMDICTTQSD